MEEINDQQGSKRYYTAIFVFQGILLLSGMFLRLIPEVNVLFSGIAPAQHLIGMLALISAFEIDTEPDRKRTKNWLLFHILYNCLGIAMTFLVDYVITINAFRVLYSLLFIVPMITTISYLYNTDFVSTNKDDM
ncbi:MAG: hypothetical protein ACFFF9_03375 [Candidatus Thorarchaeota archaeon]